MRQKDESDVRATLEKEQLQREKEAHWTTGIDLGDRDDGLPTVVVEESLISFEYQRYFGRRSFGNFNPLVEKRNRTGAALFATNSVDTKNISEKRPSHAPTKSSQNPPVLSPRAPSSAGHRYLPGADSNNRTYQPTALADSTSNPRPAPKTISNHYSLSQKNSKRPLTSTGAAVSQKAKKRRRDIRRRKSNSIQ